MARVEVEFLRTNVTVGQFLAYVRAQLKKRGLVDWIGSLDYEDFVADNGVDGKTDHKAKNDEVYTLYGIEYELVRDLPYNKQTFEKKANGKVYNEIIEFIFDSENRGHGYYCLVDDGVEDEVEPVESTTYEATVTESETEAETEAESESESVESVDNAGNNGGKPEQKKELTKMENMEKMIKAAIELIHSYGEDGNYDPFCGIRGDDRELEVGDRFGDSHQLYQHPVDGAEYKEDGYYAGFYDAGELDGTCVWSIELYSAYYEPDEVAIRQAIEKAKMFGGHIYLVRGRDQASGEELGEVIVEDAYVALKLC